MAITQIKIGEQLYDIQDSRTAAQLKQFLNVPTVENYTVTLGTSWIGSAIPFYQDVTLSAITAQDTPIVDVVTTSSNYEEVEAEWGKIKSIECLAGKLRFYAKEKTIINLSVMVKVVK